MAISALAALSFLLACGGDDGAKSGGETQDTVGRETDGGPADGGTDDAFERSDSGDPTRSDGATPDEGDSATSAVDGALTDDSGVEATPTPCALPSTETTTLFAKDHRSSAQLFATDSRLLSVDRTFWALWDTASNARIASGAMITPQETFSDLAQIAVNSMVLNTAGELVLRRLSDGMQTGRVPFAGKAVNLWGIASDGSYVWTITDNAIQAYDMTGAKVLERAGSYAQAASRQKPFARPDQLLVANGASGNSSIEKISLATNTSSSVSFSGTFANWFVDGLHFRTLSGTTGLRIYELDGTQTQFQILPDGAVECSGYGNYYWTMQQDTLTLYRLSGEMVATFAGNVLATSSHYLLFQPQGATTAQILDLSAAAPALVGIVPAAPSAETKSTNYAVSTPEVAYVSDVSGVLRRISVAQGDTTALSCGRVLDFALSKTGRYAVAFAANQVLLGNLSDRSNALTIPELGANVEISSDGKHLLLLAPSTSDSVVTAGQAVRIYDAQNGVLERELAPARQIAFAADNSYVLTSTCTTASCNYKVTDLAGTASYADVDQALEQNDSGTALFALSPSGRALALSAPLYWTSVGRQSTNIFIDGKLMGVTSGIPEAWIDDSHLLVSRYASNSAVPYFSGTIIVDATGADLATTSLPKLGGSYALRSGTLIFSAYNSQVYRIDTGAVVWAAPSQNGLLLSGAANDTQSVYLNDGTLSVGDF